MGVLGITPFLSKTCPHLFRRLPDRLGSLYGKRVVIDATLITQRLHFAPIPHPHRHILGWHRILAELADAGVHAICVFDGPERSAAKTREVERRREARKVDAARGSIEATRRDRLEKLMRLLPYYRSLRSSFSGSPLLAPVRVPSRSYPLGSRNIFDDPTLCNANAVVQPTSVASFQLQLATLHSEYTQSITQLTSIPASFEGPKITDDHPDTLDARIEYAMSKQQLQMTLDEGHIWNLLSSDVPPPETESALASLAQRSTLVSRTYQRRSNAPTTQTYDECKELIRAMGVPCIDSPGPFEAEALACTLVTHGYADYVVSEDTDVLVYEAPMLRGITARESPLVLVHGDAIRDSLSLDRARYLDFALLLGTDFSQRIKHVGPNRALKFIREHGSIERVVEQERQYPPRMPVPEYLAQVGVARLVFQNLPPLPHVALLKQTEGDPNAMAEIIQRYKLQRILPSAWDPQSALAGNYFGDNPSV